MGIVYTTIGIAIVFALMLVALAGLLILASAVPDTIEMMIAEGIARERGTK